MSPPSNVDRDDWQFELLGAQGEDQWDYFLTRWLRAREYDVKIKT